MPATDTYALIGMEQRMRHLEEAFEHMDLYAAAFQHNKRLDRKTRFEIAQVRDRAEALMERIRDDQRTLMGALKK